jgi:flagellar hook-basal body complex protein FliE
MTLPIPAISSVAPISSTPAVGASGGVDGAASATAGVGGSDFSAALGKGIDAVNSTQSTADNLALQAATGQSVDPAAITVAMTQAQLMTQLVATVQSKAVTAFNTIMGMQA